MQAEPGRAKQRKPSIGGRGPDRIEEQFVKCTEQGNQRKKEEEGAEVEPEELIAVT
jgi:hypothetical protein